MPEANIDKPPSPRTGPPRALVIGAGPAACQLHLPILARLQGEGAIRLALICDLNEDRAASAQKTYGFGAHNGDASAAINDPDIDIVYVLGSAQMHLALGTTALRADKHLFVEKPIAPSWADADRLATLAARRGLIAVGGHNRRFYGSLNMTRLHGLKSGWRHAEAVFHKPERGRSPMFGANSWLGANGIHALDALVFVMGGLPEQLTAFRSGETYSALMRWADGGQGVFLCDNAAGERLERYSFHAPGISYSIGETGLEIVASGVRSRPESMSRDDGFEAEHRSFLEAITSGISPPHSLAALAPSLFLAERIEAAYNGVLPTPSPPPAPAIHRSAPTSGTILVDGVGGLSPELARLSERHDVITVAEVARRGEMQPDVVGAVLGRGSPPLSSDLLDRLPNLKVVGVVALSLSHYDAQSLLARGVTVVNASQAYADSVAELALGMAILGRRRAFESHEVMRRGGWGVQRPRRGLAGGARTLGLPLAKAVGLEPPLRRLWARAAGAPRHPAATAPRTLHGASAGLIGWGVNARAFSERLAAAGAKVLVYSEHAASEDITGASRASLAEVLACDIVSLHRGLTPETRHFLGPAELARLQPGCVLINLARGALIEPDALLRRLKRGDIFACLDTFEDEPPPRRHPLRSLPNVFLTSHLGGGSADMHAAAAGEVVDKVLRALSGQVVTTVSSGRLKTMT